MAQKCYIAITIAVLFVTVSSQDQHTHPDDVGARYINEWALHIDGNISDAKAIARQMGFIYYRPVHHMDGHHILRRPEDVTKFSHFHHNRLRRHAKVMWVEQQKAKIRKKRGALTFNDPMYNKQWYLRKGAKGGYDMNVMAAWKLGYTGKGVVVTILDDGIEHSHSDLKKNYDPEASYDINENDNDPMPRATFDNENKHGTRCAGEVASAANNAICNVGVAYNAKIGGVRMLDGDITDSVEGLSLGLRQDHIDIYSGSWGPDDNGKVVDGPGKLAKAAFARGVVKGRGGLGNIFVWASGNGGNSKDSCACDGYAGSIYTLSVSSVSENNKKPWYLEECASTLTSTYSSGYSGEKQIVTTDLHNSCTDTHTGTSASAPLAAGIIALVLEANRNLTWRDVQYITLLTSNPDPFIDPAWITNGVKRKVSLLYGYGLMDAYKMVYLSPLWRTVPEQHKCIVRNTFNKDIYGKGKAIVTFDAEKCAGAGNKQSIKFVEHVRLFLGITYTRRGDLKITLISPSNTRSVILPPRSMDNAGGPTKFDQWPLMSVQFWGEHASGKWQLEIENVGMNDHNAGKLAHGQLVIYGVDRQPIRLRPKAGKLPKWFRKDFGKYVITDATYRTTVGESNPVTGVTKQCHEECANRTACTGKLANQCEACKNFRVASDRSCVAKCPDNTFAKERICQPCHQSCGTCTGPQEENCTGCHMNSAFLPMQHRCLAVGQSCPLGMFLFNNKECRPCSKLCETCISSEKCLTCKKDNESLVLSPTGQCVRACPMNYYVSPDRICLACPSSCQSCLSGRDDGCISCAAPKILLKTTNKSATAGYCVDKCPKGFYLDKSVNVCLRCHESCESCGAATDGDCITCRSPLVHRGNKCVDPADFQCKKGQYKTGFQCLTCHHSCERCDGGSAADCLECRDAADVYYHGHCQSKCPDGLYPHNKTDKFSVHGRILSCVYCHALCATCHGPTPSHCTRCHPGLTLTPSGTCKPKCAEGSFNRGSGTICEKCHSEACAVCTTAENCIKCKNGHVLINGSCHVGGVCPESYGSLNGRCVKCPVPACHTCSGKDLQTCSKCRKKYVLDKTSGQCLPPQPCRADEFRAEDLSCQKCHSVCRTCNGPGNQDCSSCPPSSCFILGVCRPCCSSTDLPPSSFACANCSLSPIPACILPYSDNDDANTASGNLPNSTRLLIIVAFLTCALLPLAYICIFCLLQARSGEPLCCPGHKNSRRPAGPDYAPLSTDANGSPEKGSFSDEDMEMTKMSEVVIQTPNGLLAKDSDESSGVGSSPDKSPDRNSMDSINEV